jgi:hypothetical protein
MEATPMPKSANGFPTKEFFMTMLTRDIQLHDAILDLLDNCLDGVHRNQESKGTKDKKSANYYEGYSAEIDISEKIFSITDNCGGIPIEVAEKYAFRMGRGSEGTLDNLQTVGIYGIGMKRAIFKLGKSAVVETSNGGNHYKVTISDSWINSPDNWDFPIEELNDSAKAGTQIIVRNLNEEIASRWETTEKREAFVGELIKAIMESYSFIIEKGFTIKVNGKQVDAMPIGLIIAKDRDDGIKPYTYKAVMGSVSINLIIGFYAPISTEDEIDEMITSKRTSGDAGWTVVCNDRVVLYNDKSHLSGWGESGVPNYHTQFIGIRGIVFFESNTPKDLPMTTTKRGIDLTSEVYAVTKNKMREGLKLFTGYTNTWKGRSSEEKSYSSQTVKVPVSDLISPEKHEVYFGMIPSRTGVFKPQLPKPTNDTEFQRISFSKNKDEIQTVGKYIFGEDDSIERLPSKIGEECFDKALKEAMQGAG